MRQKSELRSQRPEEATDLLRSGEHPAPAGPACRFRQLAESWDHGFTLPKQRERVSAFTLAELLVSMGVLVLLVLLFTQLLNSAATITILGHKQMDADSQARQLLDRMAIDFAQMVKRSDVDYYVKSSATGAGQRNLLFGGNDQIAFYSSVPGYSVAALSFQKSPISLVAYRVNSISASSSYNKLERMGKGLLWNGATPSPAPVVFMPVPLASPIPIAELPSPTPNPLAPPAWPEVANNTSDWSSDSEVIGPQVFRFEYYYLLKGQVVNGTTYNPIFTDAPWDTRIPGHIGVSGMQDVAAIIADIAVIDPRSKVLLDTVDPAGAKLKRLNGADGGAPVLINWGDACPGCDPWSTTPGQLPSQWRAAIDANTIGLPQPAISGIRVYERCFYLSSPTLGSSPTPTPGP